MVEPRRVRTQVERDADGTAWRAAADSRPVTMLRRVDFDTSPEPDAVPLRRHVGTDTPGGPDDLFRAGGSGCGAGDRMGHVRLPPMTRPTHPEEPVSTTADSTRYLRTLWRGDKPWHWLALYVGHVQPRGYRTYWRNRYRWQLHLTPIHLHRDWSKWEAGLCIGKRTVYVRRHA